MGLDYSYQSFTDEAGPCCSRRVLPASTVSLADFEVDACDWYWIAVADYHAALLSAAVG